MKLSPPVKSFSHGGGSLVCVRDYIPFISVMTISLKPSETFETSLYLIRTENKKKWLLSNISKGLDQLNSNYDVMIFIRDLNS